MMERSRAKVVRSEPCPRANVEISFFPSGLLLSSCRLLPPRGGGGGAGVGFSRKLSFATSPDIAEAIYLYARRIFTAWRTASQEEAPATTALIADSPLFACGERERERERETGKVAFVE
jgi:hypothetical protein